jgi:hypothetical protein
MLSCAAVHARTLPNLRHISDPEHPAQVMIGKSVHVVNYIHTYIYKTVNTKTHIQNTGTLSATTRSSTDFVIGQQYYSVSFVSLRFHSRKKN